MYFTVKLGSSRFFQGNEIGFDSIVSNRGDGYDYSGRFVAPVNGTYFFIVTIANANENENVQASLVVNNIEQTKARAYGGKQFQTGL